jgi:hypothetical protein
MTIDLAAQQVAAGACTRANLPSDRLARSGPIGRCSFATDIASLPNRWPEWCCLHRTEGGIDEYVRRMYLKEEEFLEEYLGTVEATVDLLHLDWQPNFSCNDSARDEFARGLRRGLVEKLTFQDAVIFHGRDGFSSIRVYLRSSTRFTVIRIYFVGGQVAAETVCDGPNPRLRRTAKRSLFTSR